MAVLVSNCCQYFFLWHVITHPKALAWLIWDVINLSCPIFSEGRAWMKELIPSLRSWLWHHRLPNVTTTEAQPSYQCNGPCGYWTPGRSLHSPTPKPLGHKGTWTTQSLTLGWFVTLLPPFWNPSPLARATFNQGGELPLTGEPGLTLPPV